MNISDFIVELENIKEICGDLPIINYRDADVNGVKGYSLEEAKNIHEIVYVYEGGLFPRSFANGI